MIKIERDKIDAVATAIGHAMLSGVTTGGHAIAFPPIPQKSLDTAAMLAIQSVMMGLFGPNDVFVPADVFHLFYPPKSKED